MKDWKLVAQAYGLRISPEELDNVAKSLDRVEAAFRPLTREIPLETEPAFVNVIQPERSE